MSAQLSDYDYDLPRELIARRPLVRREDSRMMVLHRAGQTIEHRQFCEVKTFLQPGDLLVLNDTRVLPARQFSDDGVIEFLFLERMGPARWKCLVKPGRKMRVGATAKIDNVALRVDAITPDGERIVALDEDVDLYAGGSMPLPPYIGRPSDENDAARYQTVFAHEAGAIAAPTAGLHFTREVLREIPHTFVTLHVGPGTFLPVRSENIAKGAVTVSKLSKGLVGTAKPSGPAGPTQPGAPDAHSRSPDVFPFALSACIPIIRPTLSGGTSLVRLGGNVS